MGEKILVAGGAGFLGSHLCERLFSAGYEIVCLDNISSGRRRNIANLLKCPGFKLIEHDVRSVGSLPPVEYVFHLASWASPADFTQHPVEIALANTEGTRRLLDHARASDAKMVFVSTSEVYGDPKVNPQPETYNGNVNLRGMRGCYDESKRFGETLTEAYRRKYDLDVRTARVFNTYGPHMRPDDGRVVPAFITQALNGEDLTVYGDGTQTRSFCYVSDLVRGLISLALVDDPEHHVFNLGNENECTINDLAMTIVDLVDNPLNIVYEPLPEDDPRRRCPDITRARKYLDWEAKISLDEGLRKTLTHFESEGNY